MTLKQDLDKVTQDLRDIRRKKMTEAKKGIYRILGKVEQEGLGNIAARAGKNLAVNIARTAKDVGVKAVKMHRDIKEQGGYGEAIDRAGQKIAESVDKGLDALDAAMEKRYQAFEATFMTDGKLDYEKAKTVISNKTGGVAQELSDLVSRGKEAFKQDYRKYVPTQDERETMYAGIGRNVNRLLLRPELDKCLKFYEGAVSKLPGRVRERQQILVDIRSNALGTKSALINYYIQDNNEKMADAVRKYL